jgi:F0F1-type ATP synthase membrane subunit b/b'
MKGLTVSIDFDWSRLDNRRIQVADLIVKGQTSTREARQNLDPLEQKQVASNETVTRGIGPWRSRGEQSLAGLEAAVTDAERTMDRKLAAAAAEEKRKAQEALAELTALDSVLPRPPRG